MEPYQENSKVVINLFLISALLIGFFWAVTSDGMQFLAGAIVCLASVLGLVQTNDKYFQNL